MRLWLFLRFVSSLLSDIEGCSCKKSWSKKDIVSWLESRIVEFIKTNPFLD